MISPSLCTSSLSNDFNSKHSSVILERERQNQSLIKLNDSKKSIENFKGSNFITQINDEKLDSKSISKNSFSTLKSKKILSKFSLLNDKETIETKNSIKNLEEFVDKALEIEKVYL